MKILRINQYSIIVSIILLLLMLSDKFGLFILTSTIKKIFILLLIIISVLIIMKYRTSIKKDRAFLILSILLFCYSLYSLLMFNLQYSVNYSLISFFYYTFKSNIILIIVYLLVSNKAFNYNSLEIIVYFSLFISISSIIYLIFKFIGITPLFAYMMDGSEQKSLLIFGNYHKELRLVYYFSEPSKYALFLILPYFLSLAYFQMTNKIKYKYFSYLIFFNIFLTFSFAIIFSFLSIYLINKTLKIKQYFLKFLIFSISILILFSILYFSYTYLSINYYHLSGAFNKFSSFKERLDSFELALSLAKEYPYGIGLLSWDKYNDVKGFGIIIVDMFVRGGYIYLFLYLLTIIFIFKISLKSFNSLDILEKYLSMSLLTIFLSIQIYGPLEQRLFLVVLILLLYRKFHVRNLK